MATDTTEKGLESIIENFLIDADNQREESLRWVKRTSNGFNKDYCLDVEMLQRFLETTQKEKVEKKHIFETPANTKKFLERLRNEITNRGVLDVLRKGIERDGTPFDLYYPTPVSGNEKAQQQYAQNIFSITRQLHFSNSRPSDSVDIVLMLNGMPIITMELKNNLTKQSCKDAVAQYQKDRDAKELLFQHKRCAVHFAVDDVEVKMCTKLCGENSWFLPFNKGLNDGAGNPVNPNGLRTAYLWEEILQKPRLSDILENYAQVIKEKDEDTGALKEVAIWPRYHQLVAVRSLLADTKQSERGKRYLIQHSAGSGKSNSITWLAMQLVNMKNADEITPRFESVVVVTDRVNLDKQIRNNILAFCNNKSLVQWADDSDALKKALEAGKKVIVSTICKFPFILDTLGRELADKRFAVIIDEAHSSQTGSMASALNRILSGHGLKDINIEDNEDGLNELIDHVIKGRVLATNTNFYAFTATPKNKTLEMFGTEYYDEAEGKKKFKPFHLYSMKQAKEEGFIMDVLENYTTYDSFYKILKATDENPLFDRDQANRKLRVWVESRPETVAKKARIMVEHFHESVSFKMKGEARAMVICNGIERAIDYYFEIKKLLEDRNSPYKVVIAFSGSKEYNGKVLDESELNGFPSSAIEKNFRKGNYRFLIVADKFQTGYDEPLLHTMYVDKSLSGIKTVQTLSRLNRAHPDKKETYVLDFVNRAEDVLHDFQDFYKTTILSQETDIDKVSDLVRICDDSLIYDDDVIKDFNEKYWSGAEREELDPILDKCTEEFKKLPTGEDGSTEEITQISVKSAMKQFCRLYEFIAALRRIDRPDWEMRVTFFHLLLLKLPKLTRVDGTSGLIDLVDFEKYRVQKRAEQLQMTLENRDSQIDPIPVSAGKSGVGETDEETLEQIIDDFNSVFGDIEWGDRDLVNQQIRTVVSKLQQDDDVRNAVLNNDEDTQMQVVHSTITRELGTLTANSEEMQRRYITDPNVQAMLDNLILIRLQDTVNPPFNEQLLTEILLDKFTSDFRGICGVSYRNLEEVIKWLFKILNATTTRNLDGTKKLLRTLNCIYRTHGRQEDMQDWLTLLIGKFESYLKKIYYLREGKELTNEDGGKVQFLDSARATKINKLHFTEDPRLTNFKAFYEFIHSQRNDEAHNAPVIEDNEVPIGIHMTTAMYLYATMININEIEGKGILD